MTAIAMLDRLVRLGVLAIVVMAGTAIVRHVTDAMIALEHAVHHF
jgi:hypothetical protein